jgi:hypothetical protein
MTTICVGTGLALLAFGVLWGLAYCALMAAESGREFLHRRAEAARQRIEQPHPATPHRDEEPRHEQPPTTAPPPAGLPGPEEWRRHEPLAPLPGGRHRRKPDTGRHHLRQPVPDSGRPPRHARPEPTPVRTDRFGPGHFSTEDMPTEEIYRYHVHVDDTPTEPIDIDPITFYPVDVDPHGADPYGADPFDTDYEPQAACA